MSATRSAELTLLERANAYIALTKPDVSFLVLITTAAGYYMGVRGPVGWISRNTAVFAVYPPIWPLCQIIARLPKVQRASPNPYEPPPRI